MMRIDIRAVMAALLLVMQLSAQAAIEQRQFDDPELAERYHNLIAELRCLVCQNQNLADSNADLAKDLRDKTAEMLEAGESDQQIMQYMSDRYGDFVLYRPPFRLDTAILWFGPLLLLLIVIGVLLRHLIRRQREDIVRAAEQPDEALETQRLEARNILKNTPPLDS